MNGECFTVVSLVCADVLPEGTSLEQACPLAQRGGVHLRQQGWQVLAPPAPGASRQAPGWKAFPGTQGTLSAGLKLQVGCKCECESSVCCSSLPTMCGMVATDERLQMPLWVAQCH